MTEKPSEVLSGREILEHFNGARGAMRGLWAALRADAAKHGETLFEYAVRRARQSDTVLRVVLERLLPMGAVVRIEDAGLTTAAPITSAEEQRILEARRALHAEIEAARAADLLTVDVSAVVGGVEVDYDDEPEPESEAGPGQEAGGGNGQP